jgi:hypothetical protein
LVFITLVIVRINDAGVRREFGKFPNHIGDGKIRTVFHRLLFVATTQLPLKKSIFKT